MPNTSHYRIFDYWKDKVVFSSGEVKSTRECKPSADSEMVIYDWGEPCCWACGRYAVKDKELHQFFENNPDTASDDFFKKLYNLKSLRHNLNRCHIRPNALGGADAPDNLFLMCEECHVLSPDTTNRTAFFRWVYDRRQRYVSGRMRPSEVFNRIEEELARRGLPPLVKCFEMAKSPYELSDIDEFMRDRVGFHCSSVSDSSLIVGATDWILHDLVRHLLSDENKPQCG